MHDDEVPIDEPLVGRLLAAQFTPWEDLPIQPVRSAGTDNALFRVGEDMVVRLPRIPRATGSLEKERRWLPMLAPHLPLDIPVPLAEGAPGDGYPWHWSVYSWLEGETATPARIADPREAATALGRFVAALQQIETTGGPPPGEHNFHRGEPLASRDSETRDAIAALGGIIDADAATGAWEAALEASAWRDPGVWIHGDLQEGNLLARDGRLSAVIDFGGLGVGDPACDVMAAWLYVTADSRDAFRAALPVDDATWARGRGWALSVSLIALPYYRISNPVLAGISGRAIGEVLNDHARGG
ncbi:MAG: aminoglycoside phosphotransferase family protein [Actinomycetota bacterium]